MSYDVVILTDAEHDIEDAFIGMKPRSWDWAMRFTNR